MINSASPGTPAAAARLASHAQRAARTAIAHTILRTAPEASSAEAVRESWAVVGAPAQPGPARRPGAGHPGREGLRLRRWSPDLAGLVPADRCSGGTAGMRPAHR